MKGEAVLAKTLLAALATASTIMMSSASGMPLANIFVLSRNDPEIQHVRLACKPCERCYKRRRDCTRRYVRRHYGVRPNAGYGPGYCGYGPNQQGCALFYF